MEYVDYRVLIEDDNPSICCDDALCKKCRLCQKACQNEMGVFGFYDLEKTGGKPICINCGLCIQRCPFNAIKPVTDIDRVNEALADADKIVIISTAPAVRVGLGEEFGLERGSFVQGKMVSAIKQLGANYVLDISCGADLTITEEAAELVHRLRNKDHLKFPMFTSCCPAWVKMCEIYYPELLGHLSSAKSPIAMHGTMVKTYFAEKMGIDPTKIFNVVVAPCVAKKAEAKRDELNRAIKGQPDVDVVITTTELASMIKAKGIDFNSLEDEDFDSILGHGSSSGLIFGNTGGVMQAALRTANYYVTGKNMTDNQIEELNPIRGIDNLKFLNITIGEYNLRVAAVSQMSEVKKLIEMIKNGEVSLDFVEVMACSGGCANGGGQPKVIRKPEQEITRKNRNTNLYSTDNAAQRVRFCHENPEIRALYQDFLGEPLSKKSLELLHTRFYDKSYYLDVNKKN